jgi:Ala-tRNA(Pro) deacylase
MRIEKFLKNAGVSFEKHRHGRAFTAQELAAEEHVSGHRVAKSVVVHIDDKCVLCVLPASRRVDLEHLAVVFGAQQCSLANEAEMQQLFPDVELGAEPPFGGLYGLETIVDEQLTRCESITFPAGTHRKCIEMDYPDYADLVDPKVMTFSLPVSSAIAS